MAADRCRTPDAASEARSAPHTDSVSPQAARSPVKAKEPPSPSPVKERVRSNSLSTPAAHTNRKRTSSGVFQVDETEPPAKKPESARPETRKRPEVNGRKSEKDGKKDKKVIERFDAAAQAKCVSAFKESDSWD